MVDLVAVLLHALVVYDSLRHSVFPGQIQQQFPLLYIDLSGGMRDTATLLLIVARYLKDIRMVQTKKVLYSELKGNSSVVRDSTGLYNLMDLITAVDAFFSTGTTEKLKAYMKQKCSTTISAALLCSMRHGPLP